MPAFAARRSGVCAFFTRRGAFSHGAFARGGPTSASFIGNERMLDILLLGLGIGVFALMAAYAHACERI
jgi:hypothetical protein